jgi:hypothetical protein
VLGLPGTTVKWTDEGKDMVEVDMLTCLSKHREGSVSGEFFSHSLIFLHSFLTTSLSCLQASLLHLHLNVQFLQVSLRL